MLRTEHSLKLYCRHDVTSLYLDWLGPMSFTHSSQLAVAPLQQNRKKVEVSRKQI